MCIDILGQRDPNCGCDKRTWNSSKSSKLSNCPFCGGEAEIKQESSRSLRVQCKKCKTGKTAKVLRYSIGWLEKTLADHWNKRFEFEKGD